MKYFSSLRIKLFAWITALILTFVLFSLLMNTQFMKPYYMSIQKKQHVEIGKKLSELYPDQNDNFLLEIERIERSGGYRVIIIDKNRLINFDSMLRREKFSSRQHLPPQQNMPPENMPFIQKNINQSLIEEKGHIFIELHDPRLNIDLLDMYTALKNDEILLLSGQIDSMKNSINIATRFFMLTGIITVILGSFAAFLFSRKFTQPITELTAIAVSMSHLNFSHKYQVKSNDEIGDLGSSINSLSDQLFHSISELQEVNNKLQKDIEKEREIDQMRKEFVSNVSHELKTPISLIQGYAEGLKQNIVDDEENKNYYCEVIIDEALKMEKHVKELLELSQLESGVFKIECSQFDLSLLLNDIITRFDRKFQEKQINLKASLPSETFVIADKTRIEQIIINYINNAMNHINEVRIIDISISKTAENKIRLSIFNSGNPLPDNEKTKIWDSYYKVDKARTRTYGGSGLGLSIVKAIQEKHGNGYGVENIHDGVSFWIDLTPAI